MEDSGKASRRNGGRGEGELKLKSKTKNKKKIRKSHKGKKSSRGKTKNQNSVYKPRDRQVVDSLTPGSSHRTQRLSKAAGFKLSFAHSLEEVRF